jgi:hypothetical protein
MNNVSFFLCLLVLSPPLFPQEAATVPEALRRPERGEAPRYPKDVVIGEMGRGAAPEGAYVFAEGILSFLVTGGNPAGRADGAALSKSLLDKINEIGPVSYRLGGGRTEADGCVSFMVRFLGREDSITGELFLRREDAAGKPAGNPGENWLIDDLTLEGKRALAEIRDSYRYDFSPYGRFY